MISALSIPLGGTGKTRLAIACGVRLMGAFADGVFLVPLAPVAGAGGVAAAVAEALATPRQAELGPEQAVIEQLRAREMLLIVDNLEHVLDAVPLFGRIVDAAPGVSLLATSQAPLRLSIETVRSLEGLELPPEGLSDPGALAEAPAVALFVERARAADPTFVFSETNATSVAELCRRLEGLPLALELAAARVRVAGTSRLLAALERGLHALGRGARDLPARHRGVRAALEYTVSLLSTDEMELFAALGAFADAWSIEQAEAMFGQELDTWEALAALSDFSLIRTRGDGRITMAQRVRAHARELLAASGREHDARRRHAELIERSMQSINSQLNFDLAAQIARTPELLEEIDYALVWSRTAAPSLYRQLVAVCGRPFHFIGLIAMIGEEVIRLTDVDDRSDVTSALSHNGKHERTVRWICAPLPLAPGARPAAPSVVGPARPIGSEPWFPAEGGADASWIRANPGCPLGREGEDWRQSPRSASDAAGTRPSGEPAALPARCPLGGESDSQKRLPTEPSAASSGHRRSHSIGASASSGSGAFTRLLIVVARLLVSPVDAAAFVGGADFWARTTGFLGAEGSLAATTTAAGHCPRGYVVHT